MRIDTLLGRFGRTAALAAAVLVGATAAASAATLTTTFDVGLRAGATAASDPTGLAGSTFRIDSVFAEGATFQGGVVSAQSTKVTISGASVASSNGMFDIGGLGLVSRAGVSFGKIAGNIFLKNVDPFDIAGIVAGVKLNTGPMSGGATNGTPVTQAFLDGITFLGRPAVGSGTQFGNEAVFSVGNFNAAPDVAPVPLPAALPLMLAGLGGLGGLSALRRRRVAA